MWRGADDSYINLRHFFGTVMPTLPATRLYFGRLRKATELTVDLPLKNQPALLEHFGLVQWGQVRRERGRASVRSVRVRERKKCDRGGA